MKSKDIGEKSNIGSKKTKTTQATKNKEEENNINKSKIEKVELDDSNIPKRSRFYFYFK